MPDQFTHPLDDASYQPFVVAAESAEYRDVHQVLVGLRGPTQKLNEIATVPVCRVRKHAHGHRYCSLILAAPAMEKALRALIDAIAAVCEDGRPGLRAAVTAAEQALADARSETLLRFTDLEFVPRPEGKPTTP